MDLIRRLFRAIYVRSIPRSSLEDGSADSFPPIPEVNEAYLVQSALEAREQEAITVREAAQEQSEATIPSATKDHKGRGPLNGNEEGGEKKEMVGEIIPIDMHIPSPTMIDSAEMERGTPFSIDQGETDAVEAFEDVFGDSSEEEKEA